MIPFALNLQTFGIGLLLSAALAAAGVWYVQGLKIDKIEATHAAEIARMETKVAVAEGETSKLKLNFENDLETKRNELDQKYDARVADISTAVNKLSSIRLRDPSASSNSGSTGDQGNAEGNYGPITGELSYSTSQFLWSFAGDADVVRERLAVCKAWNTELEAQSQKYYDEIQKLKKQLK